MVPDLVKSPSICSRRNAGFTMIELVTVMLIIGILAVVVLPRLDVLQGFDEVGYRDQVRATLGFARKSAVAQRRWVCVDLNLLGTGLAVTRDLADPDTRTFATVNCTDPLRLPGRNSNEIIAPTGVILAVPPAAVLFDPLGRAKGAAGPDCTPAVTTTYCYSVQGPGSPTAQIIKVERETGYVH